MTLLVASVSGSIAWMLADTAITSPTGAARTPDRIKIIAAHNSSLIGFAGDVIAGERALSACASLLPGDEVVEILFAAHRESQSVDFAYAYMRDGHPQLVRVANGNVDYVGSLFIGC